MIFALDFDETYNLDPLLFDNLISVFQQYGHQVILATYRHPELDYDPLFLRLEKQGVKLYCTDGKAKKPFLEALGISVAIWIDDNPNSITLDSAWKHDSPELHAWRIKNKDIQKEVA